MSTVMEVTFSLRELCQYQRLSHILVLPFVKYSLA